MTGLRIGAGAGFAGDRIEPAVDLVERGELDVIVLECLAERTIALGQQRRLADPEAGYEPRLDRWVDALAVPLRRTGTRLISNFGAANPLAAGRRIAARGLHVAVVTGDDVLDAIDRGAPAWEDGRPLEAHGELISANAYLGADALLPALDAQIVVCGRCADPSLFLAPMIRRFGWATDDWDRLAAGTVVGHLLECAGQLTGGYFADPPYKTVPDLANLGFPLAIVNAGGGATLTKLPATGGRLDRMTVAEQLAYEVTDPAAYLTPDVTADFTSVRVHDHGANVIGVTGARGRPRPKTLKVSVGYRAGFRGEAEISYAGANADARARLAEEIVRARLGEVLTEIAGGRLHVATLAPTRPQADAVGEEVTALHTNGPAGGGGVRTRTEEVIGILSTTIAREAVHTEVHHL